MVSGIAATGFRQFWKPLGACLVAGALLAGCAGDPNTGAIALGAGVPAGATTFALAEPSDEAGRMAAPHVERRLRRLGFEPAAEPDLLVEIGGAERSRAVGAYVPDACDPATPSWVEPREDKWLAGGGTVLTLTVRLIDAQTGSPVFQASSHRRAAGGFNETHAEALAAAALARDPREARPAAVPHC